MWKTKKKPKTQKKKLFLRNYDYSFKLFLEIYIKEKQEHYKLLFFLVLVLNNNHYNNPDI